MAPSTVRLVALAAALTLSACSSSTDPKGPDADAPSPSSAAASIHVERVGNVLKIANGTDRTVYFDAMTKDVLFIVAWKPCTTETHCRSIPRGEMIDLKFEEVTGYAGKSTQATIYWWNVETGRDGKPVAGNVRTIEVEL